MRQRVGTLHESRRLRLGERIHGAGMRHYGIGRQESNPESFSYCCTSYVRGGQRLKVSVLADQLGFESGITGHCRPHTWLEVPH